jgi:hypothetical protein
MAHLPLKTFLSYAHGDEAMKDELRIHLAPLVREKKLEPWQDRDIEAGEEWDTAIRSQLEAARIIVLLITPRFLASRYCFDEEMQRAMERHGEGRARVVPIIVKPCDWKTSPFSKLQVLPKDGLPITQWPDQDTAFVNVIEGLRRVVDSLQRQLEAEGEGSAAPKPVMVGQSVGERDRTSAPSDPPANPLQKRLELVALLSGLPKPQFEQILFALDVPAANRPAATLPQGERTTELLAWVTSDLGCGLNTLEAAIHAVLQR